MINEFLFRTAVDESIPFNTNMKVLYSAHSLCHTFAL